MAEKITVIGAGPGGYVAAIRCAQLGAAVTLIEKENVGGTCLNWGCIPSKIMITTAAMLDRFRRAAEFGVRVGGPVEPDMQRLNERKLKIVQNQRKGIHQLLKHHGIRYVSGRATITTGKKISVVPEDEAPLTIDWDRLILAAGSSPMGLASLPFDGRKIISSKEALNLDTVPESILIVGGGVIGCEFAFIFSALGARVTVVETQSRLLPLPSIEESCSKILQREMKKRKINIRTRHSVQSVSEEEGRLRVTITSLGSKTDSGADSSENSIIDVDRVLVCVGRRPNTDNLGIENIGVETDEKGWINVNEYMETAEPGVYAIGDVLGPRKFMLAHVASTEGTIAAENAMGGARQMNYDAIPGAVFTMPEVAHIGLTEVQARQKGISARSDSVVFRIVGKAQVSGDIAGEATIVSDADNGRILGVHLVGAHASDLIAESAAVMRMEGTIENLAQTIHVHPTLSEIMLEVSRKAMGTPLHG